MLQTRQKAFRIVPTCPKMSLNVQKCLIQTPRCPNGFVFNVKAIFYPFAQRQRLFTYPHLFAWKEQPGIYRTLPLIWRHWSKALFRVIYFSEISLNYKRIRYQTHMFISIKISHSYALKMQRSVKWKPQVRDSVKLLCLDGWWYRVGQ